MRANSIKEMHVKTKAFAFAVVGLAAALAVPVQAQFTPRLRADVPFEFSVANQTMPAGEYVVSATDNRVILVIQSTDRGSTAAVLSNPVQASQIQEGARLVFRKYGNSYFLAQIWASSTDTGRELIKSRTEREVSKTASRRETTIVLAKR